MYLQGKKETPVEVNPSKIFKEVKKKSEKDKAKKKKRGVMGSSSFNPVTFSEDVLKSTRSKTK